MESQQRQPASADYMKRAEAKYVKKIGSNGTENMKKNGSNGTEKAASLPTKSWSALLKDAPLNPDAKPFTPSNSHTLHSVDLHKQPLVNPPLGLKPPSLQQPPGLDMPGKSEIDLLQPEKDDPEWMLYLSQKLRKKGANKIPTESGIPPGLQNSSELLKSGNRFERSNRTLAERMRSNAARTTNTLNAAGPDGSDAAPPSNLVIHTEEYLKILKQGKPKARGTQSATNGSTAVRAGTRLSKGKSPLGSSMSVRRQPGETDSSPMTAADSTPMMASGLARKWVSAFKAEATEDVPEDNAPGPTTQDDMWIEKALVDQDLSDPIYFSETESVERKGASAHRFGRRPRTAKSLIRTYVMQDLSFELDQTVGMLLLRLQRFTDQHRRFNQETTVQRRFVIGLKEVARRTKQGRVDCLIVAPDIEEDADTGGLDDRMRELLASAYQNSIPVIFALSRARLGRALGKSLHISVLGVLDTTGAKEFMAQSIKLSSDFRQAWLSRVPANTTG